MKLTRRTLSLFGLALGLLGVSLIGAQKPEAPPSPAAPNDPRPPSDGSDPKVQIAILLDTSSSMDGLIAQAKGQLWKIVNEFGRASRSGKKPRLELALYEYGKSTLSAGEGYLRMIVPFTDDLDKVSEELFALSTMGGEEYCGKVIQSATQSLAWSPRPDDLKLIFIAGNEPFTQGDVDYHRAIRAASAKGIKVNTIYCGDQAEGAATGWRDGAMLADGRYLSIDMNRAVANVDAPQDQEIARLGAELNATYIPYGTSGRTASLRQAAQDSNASALGAGSMVQRSISKASGSYSNTGWDLVDASKNGAVKLESLRDEDLPPAMQRMNAKERTAYVDSQNQERARIQGRIADLDQARRKFVAQKQSELAGADTLDGAVIASVRAQAAKAGFRFE